MSKVIKRVLSMCMSVMILVSSLPVNAFAEDSSHSVSNSSTSTTVSADENIMELSELTDEELLSEVSGQQTKVASVELTKLEQLYKRADEIIFNAFDSRFAGTNMSEEEIVAAIKAMTYDELSNAIIELDESSFKDYGEDMKAFETDVMSSNSSGEISEADVAALADYAQVLLDSYEIIECLTAPMEVATSGSYTAVEGVNVTVSGATSTTQKDGLITVTAKGSGGAWGIGAFSKTTTIVVKNNDTANKANISFDWKATNCNTLIIDGVTKKETAGKVSKAFEPGESITITITTGKNSTENKLVLSGFSCELAQSSSNITFNYDEKLGEVSFVKTAEDGSSSTTSVENGKTYKIEVSGVQLNVTPASGAVFLGWIDEDGKILYNDASFTFEPAKDMTLTAVFTNKESAPWYKVDGTLTKDLNKAFELGDIVVLAADGTLPKGNYEIPQGKTLLIPYDVAETLCTTKPTCTTDAYTNPTAYRTLYMESGAVLTVNGALSLSGKQLAASTPQTGTPTGAISYLKMNDGSSIVVKSGGCLYAWGYIYGDGAVTAESGASVYEEFQLMDWRGGTATSSMIDNKQHVFPMSQYYIQNIQVPLTLYAGANEYAYMPADVTLVGVVGSSVPFLGTNGMFQLDSGYAVKDFIEETGRMQVDVYGGNITLSSISISMKLSLIGNQTIDSSAYNLPINGSMTINLHSGDMLIDQDIMMQPGAQINVGKNASCKLSKGTKVYVYDKTEWGGFCNPKRQYVDLPFVPDGTATVQGRDNAASIEINGVVDASEGTVYTTVGGANIYSTGSGIIKLATGTETKTYQCTQNDKEVSYVDIAITPAKLKNADGSYVESDKTSGNLQYKNGKWNCVHSYSEVITTEAKCDAPGVKTFTCKCGDNYTEDVKALGHDEQNHAGQAAKCTEKGWEPYVTCSRCDYTTYKEIPALGHDEQKHAGQAAKCTEKGWEAYVKCSRCDYTTYKEIPALGHDEQNHAGQAAKCTEKGWEAYVTCSRCDYSTYKEIPALGHKLENDDEIPATCTEPGSHSGKHCTNKGCKYTEGGGVIEALGHAWNKSVITKQPTCLEAGERLYTCTRTHTDENGETVTCGVTKTEPIPVDTEIGHSWDEGKITTKPTCIKEGVKTYTCTCKYTDKDGKTVTCDAVKTKSIPVDTENGHSWDKGKITTEPTCVKEGVKTYTCTCSYKDENGKTIKCDATRTESVPVDTENGHVWDKGVTKKVATCMEEGEILYTCTEGCAEEAVTKIEKVDIDPKNHAWDKGEVLLEESCCTEGEIRYTCQNPKCKVDGKPLTKTETIECNPEKHEWITAQEEIPARCERDGHYAGSQYCVNCNADKDGNPIPALEHNYEMVEAKNPTYTNVGWNEHEKCTICGDKKGYEEIPKLEAKDITTYEEFMENLPYLELMAEEYAKQNPGKDPVALVIKYIRTGVDRYNSGSWGIMAGYEDADFAKYVQQMEDMINSSEENDGSILINVSGLKNIHEFTLPNGDKTDFGHMFGTMDITYHNNGSENHADVAGWAGDLVDLLTTTSLYNKDKYTDETVPELEELVTLISEKYLFKDLGTDDKFGQSDWYGDLDAFYIMQNLKTSSYKSGDMTALMQAYFTENLNDVNRAEYLLNERLDGVSTRSAVREAVYNEYTGNKVVATLEGTRDFSHSGEVLNIMRKACCYAFADYLCKTAGDYVDVTENSYYTVFDSKSSTLAPGITQQINYAMTADNKQIAYYIATADVRRDDVHVLANYASRDPQEWEMMRVEDQAENVQNLYGNPESSEYIENFNVVASINASGYNMSTGQPSGLLVMHGKTYSPIGANGFFAMLDDGSAVIGTTKEWDAIKDNVTEAVGGFGTTLIRNGEIAITATDDYYSSRASRTAVGITATGKVVFMVLDGRQEPFSCGGSMEEVAQIMYEAGCVEAINLDGGGSSTYVAKQVGDDEISLVNRPSDGFARSVSNTLLMASTTPSSTTFDHALLETKTDYVTVGTPIQVEATGISPAGNATEIPEGATWSVYVEGDNIVVEEWATITEDGVLTGKRNCDVEVRLMLDDEIIGKKTISVVTPDQLYFTRDKVDAVYGASVELPLKARYEGKEVAINSNDISFTLGNNIAGEMQGFSFVVSTTTTLRSTKVTAALTQNASVTASIDIALYEQGENSFDFEQATGGDRMLAWDRKVSNANEEDTDTYRVIDSEKDMVTSYVLAMDMTQIPIPERLEELTYMLPGSDIEGASAWTFLLQLAERISDMTVVKPTITFDERFDVDISDVELINEYFELKDTKFDESTNTVTFTLNWKKQTQAIDAETANPLCIVNGIKVTPKDGVWENTDKIEAIHTGSISYKIYMRASGLYSFANKKENQEIFGIYPYINPKDSKDAGGYFTDTYIEFKDTYTLLNSIKEGWVREDGGFAYYVDGERLTGVQQVDGYYYDFGDEGLNVGQTKYTGVFYDDTNAKYRYSYQGTLASGWQMVNSEWYYFNKSTMTAVSGKYKIGGVYFDFEENGKLKSGVWANTLNGTRYYYGPGYYLEKWQEIDGEWYYFKNGYRLTGYNCVGEKDNARNNVWYDFGEDGISRTMKDGFYEIAGELYYILDSKHLVGLQEIEGDYYFFLYSGVAIKNQNYYAWETHCDLPKGTYEFGSDGKMLNGIIEKEDGYYYYVNGKAGREHGLLKINDNYYFVLMNGKLITNQNYYAWETSCDLTMGSYYFDESGKLADGVIQCDGKYVYCVNGKISKEYGLLNISGSYYFVLMDGSVIRNQDYYAWESNCDLPKGTYEFGSDGKMLNGIIEKEDGYYYYVNGKAGKEYGLLKIDDNYYFALMNGKLITNQNYYAWESNCDLPKGTYEFGSDGKMLDGIIEKEDGYYYYVNGKAGKEYGLLKIDDNYYLVLMNGKLITSQSYYAWETRCDLPIGTYEFGSDGKILNGIIEKEDGYYYYENGKAGREYGLLKIDNNYYLVLMNGKLVINQSYYAWETHCDLPKGTYEFGSDGKMLNGIIEKEDGYYYYVNGNAGKEYGLLEIDNSYYLVLSNGKLVANQSYYAWETHCDLPKGIYEFGADGKALNGIVEKSDGYYYYVNGKAGVVYGLFKLEGYYYFALMNGKLITNQTYDVWETNGLLIEKSYVFDELGRIIG